jgi:hypothetical protein
MKHLFVLTPHGQQGPCNYSTQTAHYAIERPEDDPYRLKRVVLQAMCVTAIVTRFVFNNNNKIIVVKYYPTNFLPGVFRR